ncbi:MAG: 3-methyl-2-oxobutanoate hydroxymethyltransferase [Leptospiraceae bacterium]|nr:3-methyl-2-oxobutanoate hydroxymethyltransferase [Leptospiraceae bacterium]MDW8307445.1 3-methyl-2-oxobutanoate hydroxymethyltransferase [Leptospiraceae bacterium]
MASKPVRRVQDFHNKKAAGEKIAMVTCYDYTFGRLLARTSVDCVLVGDSLGNIVQGHRNTLPVTLEEMIYHTRAVRRALPDTFLIADLPFLSYQSSVRDAILAAGRLVKEGGCDAVKLEGGSYFKQTISALIACGIPVMGHLGLTPQWILQLGGHRLQAKSKEAQESLLHEAKALEEAGIFALVLEMVPSEAAARCQRELSIPVIGIGSGKETDGQVLVLTDLLGLDPDFKPRFARHFAKLGGQVLQAVEEYNQAVREGSFPSAEESFFSREDS